MNKLIGIILIGCLVVSCSSRTDLEALKFDEDISKVIEGHKEFRKNLVGSHGLKGYSSTKLDGFKLEVLKFHPMRFQMEMSPIIVIYGFI